jgi:ABC-2 type transport system ATP-binding protein
MIEIKDLNFGYKRNCIFEHISLTMEPGKIYGLLGENGVGKTTLLRIIAGLLFPDSGSCSVFGMPPEARWPVFLQNLFYLPEEFSTPSSKVSSFVATTGRFYPTFDMAQYREYMREFDVDDSKKFFELSFGQRKKAMIAFGLATNVQLFLLDEPTNGLDILSKAQFRKVVAGAATDDNTFIISTHQVRDLENLIDPIIILDQKDVLLNHSMEEIIKVNNKFADIEQLFITAVKDKAAFKQLFNTKNENHE